MKQLIALSEFLIGLNLFDANDFDSWAENPDLQPSSKDFGNGAFETCRHTYKAVFYIERFPHKRHDPALLYAHLTTWLQQNDVDRFDRSEAKVIIDVAVLDAQSVELTIEIDFAETVTIKEDPSGSITFNGKTYGLAPAEIWIAEQGDIVNG